MKRPDNSTTQETGVTENRSWPVFYDPSHRRARIVAAVSFALLLAMLTALGFLIQTLLTYPTLDTAALRPAFLLEEDADALDEHGLKAQLDLDCAETQTIEGCALAANMAMTRAVTSLPHRDFTVYAFLPYWPEWLPISVEAHAEMIDVLVPELYRVELGGTGLRDLGADGPHIADALRRVRRNDGAKILPTMHVSLDKVQGIEGPLLERTIAPALADQLLTEAVTHDYAGMCMGIDAPGDAAVAVITALADRFETDPARQSCLVTSMDQFDRWPTPLIDRLDRVILRPGGLVYAQQFPSPVDSLERATDEATRFARFSDPSKFVIALGTRAASWTSSAPLAEAPSFVEALADVVAHGASVDHASAPSAQVAEFATPDGQVRTTWFQDVTTAYQRVDAFAAQGARNFAVWPVGGEDPGIWALLSPEAATLADIGRPRLERYVVYQGEGPLIVYAGSAREGLRVFTPGPDGRVSARYTQTPSAQRILRWGKPPPLTVFLTFDDGPDPVFTPQILDVLKAHDVPANFFVIGQKVGPAAEIVQRMLAEGHTVGSHTYTHPRLSDHGDARLVLEMALTQKALEQHTGHSTNVLRMPYSRGIGPADGREAAPIEKVTELGYVIVMSDIVPPDWEALSGPEIVDHVMAETGSGQGKVIVLHDSGGPRENVVDALPLLIERLRAEGYRFIGLPEVVGAPVDQLVPLAVQTGSLTDDVTFFILEGLSAVLKISFWVVIGAGAFRSIAVLILSLIRRQHRGPPPDHVPSVAVLVPAYNEALVVEATINAALASDYPNYHVYAIDDGSTDDTLEVMRRAFDGHPRVTILAKENGGKSSALNHAIDQAREEILVAIDADTLPDPAAIGRLVRHFSDPRVGAVAGNVKVGNRRNLLTRFQALEYITAQNIDRRAAELVNGMLVVPGAIGAWRREVVQRVGGYTDRTMAEDADLTVSIIRAGHRVVFEPDAFALTEAPESVRQLVRQRQRWALGMMQVGWKHRHAVVEGNGVGWFSLPDLLIFGVFMPLLAPLADLVFALALIGWVDVLISGYSGLSQLQLGWPVLAAYLGLPLLDVVVAMMAFHLEPRERKSLLWLLIIQRFFYRQVLYVATIRANYRALTGRVGRWQKVTRTSALVPPTGRVIRARQRDTGVRQAGVPRD